MMPINDLFLYFMRSLILLFAMANEDGDDGERGGVLVLPELLTSASALLAALHAYLEGLHLGFVGEGVRGGNAPTFDIMV